MHKARWSPRRWPRFPAAALAQDEAAPDRSQDMAWHMAQQQALASRTMAEGWSWLPGGVLWRRIKGDGSGAHPTVDDTVTVHYVGTFTDGETFDSSRQRGEPATFPLRGLIKAWQEAIPMAGVGDTIELAIPASYGLRPRRPRTDPRRCHPAVRDRTSRDRVAREAGDIG